jgi:Spy/CpxP family protein refolding chaperone
MTLKKWPIVLSAFTMTLAAGCTRDKHSSHSAFKESYILNHLDITPEQKPIAQDLIASFNAAQFKIENEKKRIHLELSDLIRSDNFDKNKAQDLLSLSKTIMDKESSALIEKFSALHGKLSPEQKLKLSNLIQKHNE